MEGFFPQMHFLWLRIYTAPQHKLPCYLLLNTYTESIRRQRSVLLDLNPEPYSVSGILHGTEVSPQSDYIWACPLLSRHKVHLFFVFFFPYYAVICRASTDVFSLLLRDYYVQVYFMLNELEKSTPLLSHLILYCSNFQGSHAFFSHYEPCLQTSGMKMHLPKNAPRVLLFINEFSPRAFRMPIISTTQSFRRASQQFETEKKAPLLLCFWVFWLKCFFSAVATLQKVAPGQ